MGRRNFPQFEELQLVTVKHHEGSTIFSYEGESEKSLEQLRDTVTELIDGVQQEVERQDGIVGHVKAFLEDEGASASFSATGGEIHIRHARTRNTRIHFAAIVFVTEEEPILNCIEDILARL